MALPGRWRVGLGGGVVQVGVGGGGSGGVPGLDCVGYSTCTIHVLVTVLHCTIPVLVAVLN